MSGGKKSQPDRLQSFDDGAYERPNQPYTCGNACEGVFCLLGPSPKGDCQADRECQPKANKAGKWICGRSNGRGGKCENGPTADGECCNEIPPCSPEPSLRVRRGRFVAWCAAASIGAIALMLSSGWRDTVLSPGPMTQKHAQILSEQNPDSSHCASCHAAGDVGLSQWAVASIAPGKVLGETQSEKCLKCHGEKMNVATALLPHNLTSEEAFAMTAAACLRLGRTPPNPDRAANAEIACSACHREHHGALHNLSAVSNTQCASCHQDDFDQFAAAHPELGEFPYRRRTRIVFDHLTHMAQHYPASKNPNGQVASFECRQCHLQSSDGSITSVLSYESTCASCHDEKIQQSFGDGLALLQLPMIDVAALRSEKLDIGEWPAAAATEFDGELPNLTRALLSTDPFARSAVEHFGTGFEFLDVDPSDIDDVESVHDIAWGIKYLIYDMVEQGPPALAARLEKAMGTKLPDETARNLTGHISPEAIKQLQRAWFPNLKAEVEARRAGRPIPAARQRPDAVSVNSAATGWVRDDSDYSLRYRPTGHASDFMKSWIATATESNLATLSDDFNALWNQLSSSTSNGLCITCHSVDQGKTASDGTGYGKLNVHWRGRDSESTSESVGKSFTKFSHDPHLILPGLQDCTSCHAFDETASSANSYSQPDPYIFESSFQPMAKAGCASCHNGSPESAGSNCTQCHNYHVEHLP